MNVPEHLHIHMSSHPAIKESLMEIRRNTGMTVSSQIVAVALHDYAQKVRPLPVLAEGKPKR